MRGGPITRYTAIRTAPRQIGEGTFVPDGYETPGSFAIGITSQFILPYRCRPRHTFGLYNIGNFPEIGKKKDDGCAVGIYRIGAEGMLL